MKKYIVEMSETAEQDLENIISYLRYDLAGDIIADKYKLLFK
jgi:plasmid stabilization system protein ParE